MDLKDVWIPYAITHAITILLIFICYAWPKIGKVAWGIIFLLAGIFNIFFGITNPQMYLELGQGGVGFIQKFINGVFYSFTSFIVTLIGTGQILVGIFLFKKKTLFLLGILGGTIFLVAITPLGIGAAFPSMLLMAFSLVLLYLRYKDA